MKKLILIAVLFLMSVSVVFASSFCGGWKTGYKNGACYGKIFCIAPITPICPRPRINENSYQDGYNRGFLAGLNKR